MVTLYGGGGGDPEDDKAAGQVGGIGGLVREALQHVI